MRVIISPKARHDLRDISRWIAADSPQNAEKFLQRLLTTLQGLDSMALRYPQIDFADLRRMPFENYLVFYRVTAVVEIVRIGHAARDWSNLLDDAD